MSQFVSNLKGKKLCIIGGTGFTGMGICLKGLSLGMKITSVSRSGEPHYHKNIKEKQKENVRFIKCDVLDENRLGELESVFSEADLVVHCIGTLLEGKGNNTYQKMNADSAINVATTLQNIAQQNNTKINMVYISASRHPPFLSAYLTSKQQAEQFINQQPNLRSIILKPGFIYSREEKPWSIGLYPLVNIFSYLSQPLVQKLNQTKLSCLSKNIDVDSSIDLESVAFAAIVAGLDQSIQLKYLHNSDMLKIKNDFINQQFNVKQL